MTRRKRTLLGTTRTKTPSDPKKPLPLAAWGNVEMPPREEKKRAEPAEAPVIEKLDVKKPPEPEPVDAVPDEEITDELPDPLPDPPHDALEDEEITEGPEPGPEVEAPKRFLAPPPPAGEAALPPEDGPTEPVPIQPVPLVPEDPYTTLVPDEGLMGNRIGQWMVDGLIGQGQGCSLVRAHHHQSERIKATLKILDPEHFDDSRARERLVREGEILFPLDHPSIASVRNLMLGHDPPYLEFEAMHGERLDQVLARRKTLFMAEALDLVEQLLGILVYLHEKEVFHLDIQPSNIMVRPDGVITLVGFSNAVEREAPRQDEPFSPLPYLPPEWPDVSRARLADLYATGALLYQLLTGERPFDAPFVGGPLTVALVLQEKQQAPFLDPGGRFHEDLRAVVRHLTTREPAGRLADAADALGRLQGVERSYAS